MPKAARLRSVALCAMAALIAAPPAAAVSPPTGADIAEPNADVCRALGFEPRPARGYYSAAPALAKPMPSPRVSPPPPPPPPAVAPPQEPGATAGPMVEALIVTGQKREEDIQDVPIAISAFSQQANIGDPELAYPYGPPAGTIDRDRYEEIIANPIRQVADAPVSTFSIDVDTASYANVRRYLVEGRKPPADAVRLEELINYFDYGYEGPASAKEPFRATAAVVPSPWSADRQIIHIGLQGYDIPRAELPPLNLVFLIDTSGSMDGQDRLPLAKRSLDVLINQLRPQDHVAMVAYAGSAGAVLSPTSGKDKVRMRCALGVLESGGSTAGGAGLELAYKLAQQNFRDGAVNRVILLTDGDFNVGVNNPDQLEDFIAEKRKTGVYLSVYGFGHDNYNDLLMQKLAQAGNGTAAYVDSLDEGRKVFRDDFSASLFPIADDVKIQVEFNPAVVREYRLIGYETRMLNREDFNNDRVDAGEVGAGAAVTALYEVALVGSAPSNDPLRYQKPPRAAGKADEYAFLKVRYKLPGESKSHLMSRPITRADGHSVRTAPESTRWAMAVAGFGQKLRGDPWLEDSFGWTEVEGLARGAMTHDEHGLRAQFLQLVRLAAGNGPVED